MAKVFVGPRSSEKSRRKKVDAGDAGSIGEADRRREAALQPIEARRLLPWAVKKL
ncbi:MAG: hypothetical protein R3336_06465 [Phycisphaeraceae bacterium]|nr:hypothetical protein [Phycisphaeraceae bacterium]